MQRRISARRGAAGIAAVLLFMLLGGMVFTLAAVTGRQTALVEPRVQSMRAFYASEAGQQLAIRELVFQTDEDGDGVVGGISDDGDAGNDPELLGATFSVSRRGTGGTESLRADGVAGISSRSVELYLSPATGGDAAGFIRRETWTGLGGNAIAGLTSSPGYDASPDAITTVESFESPSDEGDNFGARIIGFVYPPTTGDYTFWIASDDFGELWLSTDESSENAVLIASVPGWSDPREWDKYAAQESAPIALAQGSKYFIYALHKAGTGGDHLSVAWSGPGISQQVISGAHLSPP